MKKNHTGDEKAPSKTRRACPRRRKVTYNSRNVVSRGTQIPKIKPKLRSLPDSQSSSPTLKKVKNRISRSEWMSLERIGIRKVRRCTQSTQTLLTIFPPRSCQSPSSVDKSEHVQGNNNPCLVNTVDGQLSKAGQKEHTISESPSTKDVPNDKPTGANFSADNAESETLLTAKTSTGSNN